VCVYTHTHITCVPVCSVQINMYVVCTTFTYMYVHVECVYNIHECVCTDRVYMNTSAVLIHYVCSNIYLVK